MNPKLMSLVAVLAMVACGGQEYSVEIPKDKTISFEIRTKESNVFCYGLLYMERMQAYSFCSFYGGDLPTYPWQEQRDTMMTQLEYIQQSDEAWIHMHTNPEDVPHYAVSAGLVISMKLKPGPDGWTGLATVYPRDAGFGYIDKPVTARLYEDK